MFRYLSDESKVNEPLKFALVRLASRESRKRVPNLMACVPWLRVVRFCNSNRVV